MSTASPHLSTSYKTSVSQRTISFEVVVNKTSGKAAEEKELAAAQVFKHQHITWTSRK